MLEFGFGQKVDLRLEIESFRVGLDFPYINYNGEIVSKSTSNSGFRGCSQLWWALSPSSDGLFDQTQILSSNTIHELSGARFLAQSDESCKFWVENKRLPPPQSSISITILKCWYLINKGGGGIINSQKINEFILFSELLQHSSAPQANIFAFSHS